ncbi:hypothetical protein [Campylobacter lanienae]|nr:hypothetical protein [Campylobacter lanienae]MDD5785716.1 hypothetical protein [Campylobacter lanienae]
MPCGVKIVCYFSTDFVRVLKVDKNKKALFWQLSSVTAKTM